jgi:uncharacterized protein YecE (DUF72 family)
MSANIHIGTCSWKFDSWQGLIYSEQAKANYLQEYAQYFNTVEIDQWFWSLFGEEKVSLPKAEVVREYAGSVPEDFTFSVKVPNSITLTHFYRKHKHDPLQENPHFLSVELFTQFLETLQPMRRQLGPLMFQFEYLNKQKMPSRKVFLQRFEAFIAQCPEDYVYAIEIRNPNYLHTDYFTFLQDHHLHHVFLQGYYMPPMVSVYHSFSRYLNDLVVIRLHGPNREEIEKVTGKQWNRIATPRDDELKAVADMVRELRDRNVTVYLNVNNHYEGSAPLTIQRLLPHLELPDSLHEHF